MFYVEHLFFLFQNYLANIQCVLYTGASNTQKNSVLHLQQSFVEIDHEIFSTVILSFPLIQQGQLSVSGERMCTVLVNRLED